MKITRNCCKTPLQTCKSNRLGVYFAYPLLQQELKHEPAPTSIRKPPSCLIFVSDGCLMNNNNRFIVQVISNRNVNKCLLNLPAHISATIIHFFRVKMLGWLISSDNMCLTFWSKSSMGCQQIWCVVLLHCNTCQLLVLY